MFNAHYLLWCDEALNAFCARAGLTDFGDACGSGLDPGVERPGPLGRPCGRGALRGRSGAPAPRSPSTSAPTARRPARRDGLRRTPTPTAAAADRRRHPGRADRLRPTAAPAPASRARRRPQHRVEHRLGQPSGEGVLLADVIAAEHGAARRPRPRRRARTSAARAGTATPAAPQRRPQRRPAEPAEHDHGAQPAATAAAAPARATAAGVALFGRRLVRRRRAVHRRGDAVLPRSVEPVVGRAPMSAGWPGPTRYSDGVEPVAAAVAGEHPPGAIGAVRGRRQPDDERCAGQSSPKPGDRPTPVLLVGEGAPLLDRHLLAPRDQAWTGPAHRAPRRELGRDVAPRQLGHLARIVRHRRARGGAGPRANRSRRPSTRQLRTGGGGRRWVGFGNRTTRGAAMATSSARSA